MRKMLKWSGISACLAGIGLGAYLVGIQLTGNFAVVVPGEVYRSNQPSASEIADYAQLYDIKSIVNLRGSDDKAAWYKDEVTAAKGLGLTHIDFKMSADQELTLEEARQLTAILRDAPKPLLIHCRSGADRTGLASVIYLNRIAKVDESTAERQLSIRFGHVGIPFFSPTYAMDETWERIEKDDNFAG
ncbi:protein tyrosine/serine phosphatase [Pararhizobium capsulatum DSM 1112]|uniref:Protein tyrosine/serine phosphatase n=1 Tax=Pararhizobium capsulatum DSM 1112 TaxID=1121113 RepID=A0ABU0BKN8_9HYPH|nr:dual specificity protein phosphatase family protein [Pararhizobium capsulatum]MDQ0318458.1 protein tyrosine/serine phosphatase [Pararhizobium capsulatum DSM 1112]